MEQLDVVVGMSVVYTNPKTNKSKKCKVLKKPHMIITGEIVCGLSTEVEDVNILHISPVI